MYQQRKAFTLVEMLVVIGIIAILIAVLMPALNKARAMAQAVQCGSNLHQIYLSYCEYQVEYKGYYPALSGYQGWGTAQGLPAAQTPNDFDQVNDGIAVMQTYMAKTGKQAMWLCPSDTYTTNTLTNTDMRRISYYPNRSAWYGAAAIPPNPTSFYTTDNNPRDVRCIRPNVLRCAPNTVSFGSGPADIVMLAEGWFNGSSEIFYQGATPSEYQFAYDSAGFRGRCIPNSQSSLYGNGDALVFRHYADYTGANALYFDGHVARVLVTNVQTAYKTMLTYPDQFTHPLN
jgi:prepilin-type N-terminal cleavage/methylation domain-containing protein/prepilin-type processing-associated H-X9-DG protein